MPPPCVRGIANTAERAADPLEPAGEIVDVAPVPFMRQRQDLANPPCRDASLVYAFDVAVEDPRQLAQKGIRLSLKDRDRGVHVFS